MGNKKEGLPVTNIEKKRYWTSGDLSMHKPKHCRLPVVGGGGSMRFESARLLRLGKYGER